MKKIWNWIDCKNFASGKKYALCLWLLSLGWGLLGFVLGLGVQAVTSAGKEWLLIFTGYPILICPAAVLLYSGRHPFH